MISQTIHHLQEPVVDLHAAGPKRYQEARQIQYQYEGLIDIITEIRTIIINRSRCMVAAPIS
jgi:hypothetical protein